MLLIKCPYCEEDLPEIEFSYAGEAHRQRPRDPAQLNDHAWSEYLFVRDNRRGVQCERWYHVHGCGRYFNAVRNTITDKFLITYKAGEPRPGDDEIAEALK